MLFNLNTFSQDNKITIEDSLKKHEIFVFKDLTVLKTYNKNREDELIDSIMTIGSLVNVVTYEKKNSEFILISKSTWSDNGEISEEIFDRNERLFLKQFYYLDDKLKSFVVTDSLNNILYETNFFYPLKKEIYSYYVKYDNFDHVYDTTYFLKKDKMNDVTAPETCNKVILFNDSIIYCTPLDVLDMKLVNGKYGFLRKVEYSINQAAKSELILSNKFLRIFEFDNIEQLNNIGDKVLTVLKSKINLIYYLPELDYKVIMQIVKSNSGEEIKFD